MDGISLEQRERDLAEASRALDEASEAWLEARAKGRVAPALEQRNREAVRQWRAAARRLDDTRRRHRRRQERGE